MGRLILHMSYKLLASKKYSFLNGTIYRYKHEKTHCEVIHLCNNDPENIFIFAFPTLPKDNSGVAHILEHSVLSGSERYRVKAPFFLLEQGSCRTYLNASTYPDRTLYMGASLLPDDLFNLMAMCGDAVWFPLLDETIFRQESFHIKFNTKNKPYSAGVVYNEMKGVFSDKTSLIEQKLQKLLFSDMGYRFDSGGTPQEIPLLSYQQFKDFHKEFYATEFCKIFVYGNIETQTYLDFIEREFFSRMSETRKEDLSVSARTENISTTKMYDLQPLKNLVQYDKNGNEKIHYVEVPKSKNPAGEEGTLEVNWLLGNSLDIKENALLKMVHFALLEIPGAPLRKKLIESGIIEDLSNLSGPSAYLNRCTYTIGGMGVHKNNYQQLSELIFSGLQEIIETGIDQELIKAALSRIEYNMRERLKSTSNKVNWISSLAKSSLYNADPLVYADIPLILEVVKKELAFPRVVENYIKKKFIDNTHRVILASKMVSGHEKKLITQERKIITSLIHKDKNAIKYWNDIQKSIQKNIETPDSKEWIEKIPKLHVSQLPKKIDVIEHENIKINIDTGKHSIANLVQWVPHLDNGIINAVLRFDITDLILDNKTRLMMPTFSAALTEVGIKEMNYDKLAIKICLTTGNLGANINNYTHQDGGFRVFINVWAGILDENVDNALQLISRILREANFLNIERLKEIINEGKSMLRSGLSDIGTTLAVIQAAKNFSYNAHIDSDWNAINQLKWALNINNYLKLSEDLLQLRENIFTQNRLSISVVGAERIKQKIITCLEQFVSKLPAGLSHSSIKETIITHDKNLELYRDDFGLRINKQQQNTYLRRQAIIIPVQVACNAMVIPSVKFNHQDYAYHNIASRIISSKLLENIRMKYGAYVASASLLGEEGLFVCYTFRDPNIAITFKVFEQILEEVAQGKFDEAIIETQIVGAVGNTLVQRSPQSLSKTLFIRSITNITDTLRQQIRDTILSTKKEHIQKAAADYLDNLSKAAYASVSSKSKISKLQWDAKETVLI